VDYGTIGVGCPVCEANTKVCDLTFDESVVDDIGDLNVCCLAGECSWNGKFGTNGTTLRQHLEACHEIPEPTVIGASGKRPHQEIPNICKDMYVRYAEKHNAEKASRDLTCPFVVPPSTIRDWMAGKGNSGLPGKKRAPSSTGNANMIVLGQRREKEIYEEIVRRRQDGRFVTVQQIQILAMQGAPACFRASRSWVDRFFSEYGMTLRVPTFRKKSQRPTTGHCQDGLQEQIVEFWLTVDALRQYHNIDLANIINYDQLRLGYETHLRFCVDFKSNARAIVYHEVLSCTQRSRVRRRRTSQ